MSKWAILKFPVTNQLDFGNHYLLGVEDKHFGEIKPLFLCRLSLAGEESATFIALGKCDELFEVKPEDTCYFTHVSTTDY